MKYSPALSLIELLIVVAIFATLGATASPFISRFVLVNNFESTKTRIINSVRKAQNYSIDGKDGTLWGVCTTDNMFRLYTGTCNSPAFSEDYDIPSSINVTSLSGSTFSERGEPTSAFSVEITSNIGSSTISVNSAGGTNVD